MSDCPAAGAVRVGQRKRVNDPDTGSQQPKPPDVCPLKVPLKLFEENVPEPVAVPEHGFEKWSVNVAELPLIVPLTVPTP
jgi:hypothetical protein